ncbi:KTSC domain-containing protein [Phnomibacter sp. MR]|uniref:KTSC domain-containing protein n=1 Tax=Phnomibacter sp. MR TaxID=3042318 RepID=UPI003A801FB3
MNSGVKYKAIQLKHVVLTVTVAVSLLSCQSQSCKNLPKQFESYQAAEKLISNSSFKIDETVDTRKSSWIRGARFKSCDGSVGFLIIRLKDKTYIHQNVPSSIWAQFKMAKSFGQFYNQNIKGRYQLSLK